MILTLRVVRFIFKVQTMGPRMQKMILCGGECCSLTTRKGWMEGTWTELMLKSDACEQEEIGRTGNMEQMEAIIIPG